MEQQGQLAASRMIGSLTGWWELAGVDAAVGDTPVDLLASAVDPETIGHLADVPQMSRPVPSTVPAQPELAWPTDIQTLKSMIASGAALPGNTFGTAFVAPVGPSACDVMVVSDLPDPDELAATNLGGGATGMLLRRMLAAIGLQIADCYWTALASSIPSTGEVPENAYEELAAFVRHQMALAKPRSLILLGSAACKALLGEELLIARSELRNINYSDSNIPVLTTFHPRTLIARPALKAQAWKDLQIFVKGARL